MNTRVTLLASRTTSKSPAAADVTLNEAVAPGGRAGKAGQISAPILRSCLSRFVKVYSQNYRPPFVKYTNHMR